MKKFLYTSLALAFLSGPVLAQDASTTTTTTQVNNETLSEPNRYANSGDRAVQVGADYVFPYRVDSPTGKTAQLFGAHAELFMVPAWAVSFSGMFGIDDNGYSDKPIFVTPGLSFYGAPGRVLEPFFRAEVPFLVNTSNKDFGVRGGLGFMWNLGISGIALRYSFDATYYFDQEATTLNFANVAAVINW